MQPLRRRAGWIIWLILGGWCVPAVSAQPDVSSAGADRIRDYCQDETLAPQNNLSDLYCVNLVAVPALAEASGYARMIPTYSPFGVSVTRDGHHAYRLNVSIEGLPRPE